MRDKFFLCYNGNNEFITNAFVFANKYAPSDVLLCYNDYNEYNVAKRNGMINIIRAIKGTPGARIDVMAMQSHMDMRWSSVSDYEASLTAFLSEGVDVHISELDIGLRDGGSDTDLANAYSDWIKMCNRHRKTGNAPGVTGITIWGINDENTWLNGQGQNAGYTRYPLLFRKVDGEYLAKPAFDAVINAAGKTN